MVSLFCNCIQTGAESDCENNKNWQERDASGKNCGKHQHKVEILKKSYFLMLSNLDSDDFFYLFFLLLQKDCLWCCSTAIKSYKFAVENARQIVAVYWDTSKFYQHVLCLIFFIFFAIPLWLGLFNGFDVRELYKLYVAEQNCHSTDYSFQESFLHMLNLLINFKLLS